MDFPLSQLTSLLPVELDLLSVLKFIIMVAICSLIMSLLARMFFGKHSGLNHAISSAIGILFVYVFTVVIYTFHPQGLSRFLSPLPFVQFSQDYLYILPFHNAGVPAICENLLSLVILSLLVNVVSSLIPGGKTAVRWYLLRFLSIVLAIYLHYGVNWLTRTYLPGVLVTYAPIILIGILIGSFLLGVLNVLLSLVLTVVHPLIGALYAFFFSNIFGKQLSKSILTTLLVSAVFYVLEYFGYGAICISAAALISYLPLLIVLLLLWYLIGHLL